MLIFHFMIGAPASGKSFIAKEISNETGAVIVCPDDIRVCYRVASEQAFKIARDQVVLNLMSRKDVIFDATNTIRKWRKPNILAGRMHAEKVICHLLMVPLNICLYRQQQRVMNGEKVELPENVIHRMYDQLENNLPSLDEGFDEILVYP